MTFLELARLTLEKAKGPLTVDEIWTRGIEYGYAQQVRTTGKTPSRTIGAQLYVNIRDSSNPDFCISSKRPTRFALSTWDKQELEAEPILGIQPAFPRLCNEETLSSPVNIRI